MAYTSPHHTVCSTNCCLMLRLSAYLYRYTQNQTYYDATNVSNQFIQSHLYDDSAGYVRDTIGLNDCEYTNDLILTYNTGLYLEGLCVYLTNEGLDNSPYVCDIPEEYTFKLIYIQDWERSSILRLGTRDGSMLTASS